MVEVWALPLLVVIAVGVLGDTHLKPRRPFSLLLTMNQEAGLASDLTLVMITM